MDEEKKQDDTGEETPCQENQEPSAETDEFSAKKSTPASLSMGIETDRYDLPPEVDRDPEAEAQLEGREGLEVTYSFNGDDIREGLKVFQKTTIYKRNIIFSLLLGAMFVIYLGNIAANPDNMLSTILAVLCVAVTIMIWYLPLKHIKTTAQSADSLNMQFCMTLYDDCVRIAEEDGGSFIIHFGKEVSKTFETEHLFMVCVGKERIFILPKRHLDEEQTKKIRSLLTAGMEEKHFDKRPKQA